MMTPKTCLARTSEDELLPVDQVVELGQEATVNGNDVGRETVLVSKPTDCLR